jgi:hypothetical protein
VDSTGENKNTTVVSTKKRKEIPTKDDEDSDVRMEKKKKKIVHENNGNNKLGENSNTTKFSKRLKEVKPVDAVLASAAVTAKPSSAQQESQDKIPTNGKIIPDIPFPSSLHEICQTTTWPPGWMMERVMRQSGTTAGQVDKYFYTPSNSCKLRSVKDVEKFTKALQHHGGDESLAKKHMKDF